MPGFHVAAALRAVEDCATFDTQKLDLYHWLAPDGCAVVFRMVDNRLQLSYSYLFHE